MQEISNNIDINNNTALSDRRYLLICFILSATVYLFYTANIFYPIGNLWYHSGAYNHSYISIIISISWLSYNLIKILKSDELVVIPSIWALIGIFICAVLSLILYASQLILLLQINMIFLLWLMVCACFGRNFAVLNIHPFLLLLATIPFFNFFINYQIIWITNFLEFNLSWLGIVDVINNNIIKTNNIIISVDRSYTGLRYLNVILVISLVYGHFVFKKTWVKLLYVIISLLIAFLVNLIRIIILVVCSHFYGLSVINQILYSSGWFFFLIILLTMLCLVSLLQIIDKNNYANPLKNNNQINLIYLSSNLRIFINSCSILILLTGFNYFKEVYRNITHSLPSANVLSVPDLNHAWKSCAVCEYNNWYPQIGLPDAKLLITYRKKNIKSHIDFYIGYYEHQYEGNSLINLSNKPYFDDLWQSKYVSQKTLKIPIVDKYRDIEKVMLSGIDVNRVILQSEKAKRVVWHWYWVDGKTTNNKLYAKFLEIADLFKTLKTHSALIAISAEFENEHELLEAEFALFDFMNDNYAYLQPTPKRQAVIL